MYAKLSGLLSLQPSQSFALMQTCQCAAPSVTAYAVPPSSGRKAFVSHKPNLSLPLGKMSRSDREGVGHFPLSVISTNENKQKRADAYTSALSSGGNWWGDVSHISKQLQNAAGGGCPFRPQIPCYIMYYYLISFLQKCQSYGRSFPRSINRRVLPSFRIYKERAKYVPPSEMRTATLTNSPST